MVRPSSPALRRAPRVVSRVRAVLFTLVAGPFTLPNKTGTGWLTVRTGASDSSLPAPGTRVNPSYVAVP